MGGKSSPSVNYGQGSSDFPRPMYAEPTVNNAAYRPQSLANYERSVAPDNLGYGQYWDRGPASSFQGQRQGQGQQQGAYPFGLQQPLNPALQTVFKGFNRDGQQGYQTPPMYQSPGQQQPYQPYQPPQGNARQPAPVEQLPVGSQAPAQATIQGVQYGQLPGMAGAAAQAPSQGIGRLNRSSSEFDDWSRS